MKLNTINNSSSAQRHTRTRSLIQLGGLMEHAGTLEIFDIPLGIDLQSEPSIKNNIAALFKSFLIINEMVTSNELDLKILAIQGLEIFKAKGLSESRPLDRKKYKEFEPYSENDNTQLLSVHSDKVQEQS